MNWWMCSEGHFHKACPWISRQTDISRDINSATKIVPGQTRAIFLVPITNYIQRGRHWTETSSMWSDPNPFATIKLTKHLFYRLSEPRGGGGPCLPPSPFFVWSGKLSQPRGANYIHHITLCPFPPIFRPTYGPVSFFTAASEKR